MGIEDFIRDISVQTAVYWGNPTPDGRGGMTFDSPVEIGCRWEGKTKLITAGDGRQVVSRAEIFVTQDVDEQGYLYLGELDDFDSTVDTDNPKSINGAYEIMLFTKVPMIKSTTEFVRKVYL